MIENKKIDFIIDRMTDNEKLNMALIKLLPKNTSLKDFVIKVHDEVKTFKAMQLYLSSVPRPFRITQIMNYNGDGNFLHMAIKTGYSMSFVEDWLCYLDDFFQDNHSLLTHFINEIDNCGRTVAHTIFYERYVGVVFNKTDEMKELISLLNMLLKMGFNPQLQDDNFHDFLSLTNMVAQNEFIVDFYIKNQLQEIAVEIQRILFTSDYNYFFKYIINDNQLNKELNNGLNKDYKDLIYRVFGKDGFKSTNGISLLSQAARCLEGNILITMLELLLESGVEPNYKTDFSFVNLAIEKEYKSDYNIKRIIMLAIKYGFDINQKPSIIRYLFDIGKNNISDIYSIYVLLCDNGYITYNADFDKDDILTYDKSIYFCNYCYDEDKFIKLYRQQFFLNFLSIKLKEKGLVLGKCFIEKYNDNYIEINNLWIGGQLCLGISDDDVFANMVIERIINNRSHNINFTSQEIPIEELLTSLSDIVSSYSDKVKIKILNS